MRCKSCGYEGLVSFGAEIAIHFPGLINLDKAPVCFFPKVVVCFNCGVAEILVPEDKLQLLGISRVAGAT
jgi:hypothetical protein